MSATLTLQLGGFAGTVFDDHLQRTHSRPELLVRNAARYYLADRDAGRPSWSIRHFVVDPSDARQLTVELDDETWDALAAEAGRQGVPPERLAEHSLLYFLADLDRGRVAARLGNALQEDR
jgi:hypothetical protein